MASFAKRFLKIWAGNNGGGRTLAAKRVLLVGLTGVVINEVRAQLRLTDVELCGGSGIEDVRSAFGEGSVDHVIMGAGVDLDTRLAIVREVFRSSDITTVHMKDRASGKHGFLLFVGSILRGLDDYAAGNSSTTQAK